MAPSYEELGLALENFIKKNVEGKSVGVAFSGGMDSGIVAAVAAKYARSVTCYTCGVDDAFDVQAGKELADKLGVSRQSVSKWEGAQAVPDMKKLIQMSEVFGVSTDYLLTGSPSAGGDNQALAELLLENLDRADKTLGDRRDRPFSRQELAVLMAALLMEP